jgi:hypothetical protein
MNTNHSSSPLTKKAAIMGFRDIQKRPQAMSNGKTMALLESYNGNGNGAAMGVQCVCALPLPLHGNGKQSTTAIP